MQKIIPNLWFDTQAKEAAQFYTSLFKNSAVKDITTIHETPSGSVDILSIELSGQKFTLINAGPLFKFTPAVSFFIACESKEEVDTFWNKLSEGGMVMMELGQYPFSERYGWTQDKYGLCWQVMYMGKREIKQKITPFLLFVGDVYGKVQQAINFYTSVFSAGPHSGEHNSEIGDIMRYEKGEAPDKEGNIKYATFTLEGQDFAAMESAHNHKFTFNEAVSFIVNCETQEEIDYYYNKLSAVPASEQCGWLKDKYGLSWQIVPTLIDKMFKEKDQQKTARLTKAILKMKKFDIEELKKAYEGK